jgi:hypothetical protein
VFIAFQLGVMSSPKPGELYGVTEYWAELDGERIEFTDTSSLPEKFTRVTAYIESTYLLS